jgi:hypothetical protein
MESYYLYFMKQWLRSHSSFTLPLVMTFAVIIILTVFIGRLTIAAKGEVSFFIIAGEPFVTPDQLADKSIFIHSGAYDGLFYYRYAIDPFSTEKVAYGISVDTPIFRKQRIVYPFLCWLLSNGNVERIPWSMVIINMFGLLGMVVTFFFLLKTYKLPLFYALLPLIIPGFWMALSRNTTEITEGFFYCLALYAIVKEKWWLYAIFASITVLSREGSLILLGGGGAGIVLWSLKQKKIKLATLGALLIPLITFLSHRWYLQKVMVNKYVPGPLDFLDFQFKGILQGVENAFTKLPIHLESFMIYSSLLLTITWMFFLNFKIARNAKRVTTPLLYYLAGAFFAWSAFSLVLPFGVYEEDWAFVRVVSTYFLTALLYLTVSTRKVPIVDILIACALVLSLILRVWFNA